MTHVLVYMPKTCVCIVANNYMNDSLNFSLIISGTYVAIALICTVCKQPPTSYNILSADFCTRKPVTPKFIIVCLRYNYIFNRLLTCT